MQIDVNEQLNRGIEAFTKKDYELAEGIFNALFNLDPNSGVLLFYMGTLHMSKKHHAHALLLFTAALKYELKNEDYAAIYNNIGFIHRENCRDEEAIKAFKNAIKFYPKIADYYTNLGAMYVAKGIPDVGIETLNKALQLQENHVMAKWNRALCYLEKGDYEKGFAEYDNGSRMADERRRDYGKPDRQDWDGTPGKVVVVYGEQGMGDEIMFASLLPDLIRDCKQVIFDAHPRLADIFRHSFPRLAIYGTRKDNDVYWTNFHTIDAQIVIGSCAKFYRKKESDFPRLPYLKADEKLMSKFSEFLNQLGDKPKVGISWKGGTKQTNLKERTIPLELFLPIFEAIDADFISLQYTENADQEVLEFEKNTGKSIHHFPDALADYDATAALVSNLDFIISVPQTVVHLAGALGVPTIQMCPKKAMWQMGVYGKDMPWYSCVKNIWQDETESWEIVIQKVRDEICKLFQLATAI